MQTANKLLIWIIVGLVATAAQAAPKQQQPTSFRVPTCDEFKDRLTHTEQRTGIIISDAQYESPEDWRGDGTTDWKIPNYTGFDADILCQNSLFRYIELAQSDFPEIDVNVALRYNNIIAAPIAAWTGWPRSR